MKSKIQIDLDWDNQPIIKIEYVPSDDVRDKMVKRFLETFGGDYLATFFFDNNAQELANGTANKRATLRPLPSQDYKYHADYFNSVLKTEEEKHPTVSND